MSDKIKRLIEELEHRKEKEFNLRKTLGETDNSIVSFGKEQAYIEMIMFIKSEFNNI